MSEEKKEQKQYPIPCVGPVIYNDQGEILLTKSTKWGDAWSIFGGKVDLGETCVQALRRETKEETGLEIDDIELIGVQEAINPKNFVHKNVHHIYIDYCARWTGGEPTISEEIKEFIWIQPEKALQELKIESYSLKTIKFYLDHLSRKRSGDYQDKYTRALADYQNLLKRTAQEKAEFVKYANENILHDLIPVYDNLKASVLHTDEAAEKNGWLEGIKYVIKQFKEVLSGCGIEEISAAGQVFSHDTMEAVSEAATGEKKKDGRVAQELSAGYMLNGKVIRAARVTVYKFKEES